MVRRRFLGPNLLSSSLILGSSVAPLLHDVAHFVLLIIYPRSRGTRREARSIRLRSDSRVITPRSGLRPKAEGRRVTRKNDERVTVPGEASEWRERDETRQTEGEEETNKRRMEMANLSLENRLLTINSPFHITYHLYLYLRFIFCILFSINLISSENKYLIKSIKVLIPSF